MRSGAEDPQRVDVELVEDLDGRLLPSGRRARRSAAGPPADDGGTAAPEVVRASRGRLWSAVGALAVVALASWGLNQAEERRDESRLAALAGLPGYLDPIAQPMAVAWRSDAGRPVARTSTTVLLAGGDGGPGSGADAGSLTAVDLETGAVRWQRTGEECHPLSTTPEDLPVVAVAVCLRVATASDPGGVSVLDASSGTELRALTGDGWAAADVVDGLVVLTGTAGTAVTVRGWEPLSGLDAFAFTAGPDGPAELSSAADWSHETGDATVAFRSRERRLTFDAVTGQREASATAGAAPETLDLPGGREARWGRDHFGRPKDVVIVDREAGVRFEVPGLPWLAPVRDGSASDVVVVRRTSDKHLLGVDAGSGRVRWDLANVPWLEASVQAGGVVIAVSPSSAVALDVGTGLRLWQHEVARGSRTWDAVTDGRVVLLPSDDGDGGVSLVARRLTTGEQAWDVALPGEVVSVDEVDGRTVLVLTDSGLVALR